MGVIRIVILCVVAAVGYGLVQDQVTARVCVEYFTIGHPPVFATESPTLLALGWGVIATWWVGLLLGVPLSLAARVGKRPTRDARDLVKPVLVLLAVIASAALVAGIVGYVLARTGAIFLLQPLADQVPADRHALFLADGAAHNVAYAAGFIGGIVLTIRTWRRRRFPAPPPPA